jgi:hypothetical protein
MAIVVRFVAAICIASLWHMFAALGTAAEPQLVATAGRGTERVKVETNEGAVVIDVTSPSGIGQLTVESGDQPWPMAAKLRLRYDDKRAFTHLEGVTLTDSKSRLHTFLGSTEVEVNPLDGAVRRNAAKPEMKVEKAHGAIEVTLPLAWLTNEKQFVIHWVDFYRD